MSYIKSDLMLEEEAEAGEEDRFMLADPGGLETAQDEEALTEEGVTEEEEYNEEKLYALKVEDEEKRVSPSSPNPLIIPRIEEEGV
ncbi:hypothetical protein Ahia01_000848700 [Argonauta hians]